MSSNEVGNQTNSTEIKQEPKYSHLKRELWDWTKSIIIAFVIVLIIHQFVFNLSKVDGQSMEPTLEDKERLFVNRIVYLIGQPSHGDVVILRDPRGGRQYLVKRVVALPGDTVEIRNQRLFINGELKDEPYTATLIEDGDFGPITVEEDHYFVMGDNRYREQSLDSRKLGSVSSHLIKGRAEFIIWPLNKISNL